MFICDATKFVNNNLCIECFESSNTNIKKCKDCKIKKCMNEFYKNKRFKTGRCNSCIQCTISKNKKENKYTLTTDTFYDEFLKSKIEKTTDINDKITATTLFTEYKHFMKIKYFKFNILLQEFKIIMMKDEYLGEQISNAWNFYKIKV